MLDLVFNNTTDDKKLKQDFFVNIFNLAIRELKLEDKSLEISLNIVDEEKIKELNKQHLGKDKVTDVLSFPMNEELFQKLEIENWKLKILDLGDIFIYLPFAKKEAKMENIDIERKLVQLAVHGFLHLLGYDHEKSKEDADKMFSLERKILEKIN